MQFIKIRFEYLLRVDDKNNYDNEIIHWKIQVNMMEDMFLLIVPSRTRLRMW
jgi:hypothetical protein